MAIDKEHASIILKRVFENGVCSDRITLISGKDNQRIPIHRAILTASSKYFLASLGPNFQESKEDEFILEGTDEGTVKAIVDFCYTGCIDLTENNVKKFLTIASSIELNLLEQKCRQFYLKELSANNAVETLMFAEKYSYADLRQKAFDFICANFDTSDIHKSQHQLLQELVESNKIQSSDESVLKRLLDWFQSEEEERKQYMPKLLKFIRLDRITMQWNSVTTLMLADKYGYADLRQRALDIVCGRFAKLPAAEIQKLDHRLLKELLNCDHIQATEDMVFKRVTEWCRSKEDERSQYMPELLKLIRLEYITPQFLNETVVPVYEKLRISEIVFAEYRRRSSSQCRHMDVQRSRSIFCLYSQHEGENIIKIERYNSILNIYEIVAEISLGNRDCDNAVLHKTVVYLVGGAIGDEFLKTMTSYDLISKEKKVLPVMSIPREDCTSILFGKYIYVFGGYNEVLGIRFCERFDTEINEWKELKSMKFARYNASATILNGYIYVAGGRANPGGVRTSVELYDPKCDDWTDVKPMIKSRDKFALIESNGFLYAMGGGQREIERYDPYKARWTVIGSFDQSHLISDGINMDSQIFVIMMSGEFGRIKIDDNDKFLFVSMGKSRHEFEHFQRHYLIRN